MELEVYMKAKKNDYYGIGIYSDKEFVVKAGSRIKPSFSSNIDGGAAALKYRNNLKYVNEDFVVKRDCVFNSPSTAAQFVCGYSKNGMLAWHLNNGMNLKNYIATKRKVD